MRKILLILIAFLVGINICYASSSYSNMTRKNFPIKVYIPDHPKAFIVKKAFAEWSQKTNGKVKIDYCNEQRKRAATMAFKFVDYIEDSNPGQNTLGVTYNKGAGNTIVLTEIHIGLLDKTSKKPISDNSLYYITIHEIGHAFGLQHTSDASSIMHAYYNPLIRQSLTNQDITNFTKMYRY